ncbi:MAG: phage holin family protein [Chthoniobacteraceae bacterium]
MMDPARGSAPHASPESGVSGHFRNLLASALGYFQARFQLLGIEAGEAGKHYLTLAVFALVALVALIFGYIFLILGLVFLVAHWTGWHWEWVLLAFAGAHLLATIIFGALAWRMIGKPFFTRDFNEFKKDQEWLKTRTKSL